MAARSKALGVQPLAYWDWVRIPPGAWISVCCECCVLSGRGLCDELITRPEESYRLWCVIVWDLETSWMRRPWPTGGCCAQNKKPRIKIAPSDVYFTVHHSVFCTINLMIVHIATKTRLLCATRAVHNSRGWDQTCRSTFDPSLALVKFVVDKVELWQVLQLVLEMASVSNIPSFICHGSHIILATDGLVKQHAKSALLECTTLAT